MHPYTLANLGLHISEDQRYELLKECLNTPAPVEEVRKFIPNLTVQELVELSLFYDPIEVSKFHYDGLSLFMNACYRHRKPNALEFVSQYDKLTLLQIGWIAYRSQLPYVFEDLLKSNRVPEESPDFYFRELYNILLCVMGQPYEQVNQESLLYEEVGCLLHWLDDKPQSQINLSTLITASYKVNTHNIEIRNRWKDSTSKEFKTNDDYLNELSSIYQGYKQTDIIQRSYTANIFNMTDLLELLEIKPEDQGVHYIASSNILQYILWKRQGYTIPTSINPESLLPNRLMFHTYNREIAHVFGKELPIQQQMSIKEGIMKAQEVIAREKSPVDSILKLCDIMRAMAKK